MQLQQKMRNALFIYRINNIHSEDHYTYAIIRFRRIIVKHFLRVKGAYR